MNTVNFSLNSVGGDREWKRSKWSQPELEQWSYVFWETIENVKIGEEKKKGEKQRKD